MISYEEAMELVLRECEPLGKRWLGLDRLLGCVLAAPVKTTFPLPRFDNSAMDGFALRAADFARATPDNPIPLPVIATIRAGDPPLLPPYSVGGELEGGSLPAGKAMRIMTGAPLPDGADAVLMREEVEQDDRLLITRPPFKGENVRHRGEEFGEGDEVLLAGTRVTPPVIGMLATLGRASALVFRRPKVTLIVTGDELRSPGRPIADGQIYDSNTSSLRAALSAGGIGDARAVRCADTRKAVSREMVAALKWSDIILTVGGVSVGDYDYVKAVVAELGIREVFWRVAMKPGKPLYFGVAEPRRSRPRLIFGLPGNPVSALVSFELFVKTAIRRMTGDPNPKPRTDTAILGGTLKKKEGRLEFVRGTGRLQDGTRFVSPARRQESHMVSGLAAGDCLILFPRELSELPAGSSVSVVPLTWRE